MSQFLTSMTAPSGAKTNNDTRLLKLLAGITMLVDHCGKMLFPQYREMRLIGRLAFPLFAYCIALGAAYTKNPMRYLSRVVLLALISQPLYALGLGHENTAMYSVPLMPNPLLSAWNFYVQSWEKPSILLALSLALGILLALRSRQFILALGLYLLCERFAGSLDYGINGVRFILICYLLLEHPLLYLPAVTAFWLWWSLQGSGYSFFGFSFGMRIYGLPSVVLTALPLRRSGQLPKWLSYGFYPAHLLFLALVLHPFWIPA